MQRAIATAVTVFALAACGSGRDVRFVVEVSGEARATDLELRVGADTRIYDERAHGAEIVERDLPDGTRVSLRGRNGGDAGDVILRAFVDDCEADSQSCTGEGCVAFVELTVRESC